MKKKVLAFLVIMFISIAQAMGIVNANDGIGEQGIPVTEDLIKNMVLEWVDFINPGLNLQIKDIIELYGYDDELCGCVVSLQQNNISYGYVVLDFFTDNIITEFVIEKGAACIGDAILQETDTVTALQRTSASKIKKMYKTYPFEYSVVLENRGSEVIYDKDGEISKEAFHDQRKFMQSSIDLSNSGESNKFAHFSEIIINSIPSGYTTVDSLQTLPSKVSLTEADIIKLTSKYACVVQAMANIAS